MPPISLSALGTILSIVSSAVVVIVFLARIGPALEHNAQATSDLARAVERLTERDQDKESRLVRVETIVEQITR